MVVGLVDLGLPMSGNPVRKLTIVTGIVLACIGIYLLGTYNTYPEYWILSEVEQQELAGVRSAAYTYAVTCSNTKTPVLSFEDVKWELTPGSILRFPSMEGRVLELKGWFNPRDSTIYIPFTERNTFWILAHESLHAIGYIGHPATPFRTCRLMADQNP
jgi:hypothetical protein